jgi:hypothetical protein
VSAGCGPGAGSEGLQAKALYLAKHTGRNRVCSTAVAPEPQARPPAMRRLQDRLVSFAGRSKGADSKR